MTLELFWCITLGMISLPPISKFPKKVLGKTDFTLFVWEEHSYPN